jgi:cAMP-dependent protein kinase regulator
MNAFPVLVRYRWNDVSNRAWASVLATLPLFAGIGKRDLRRIAGEAEFSEFAPGDSVVTTGEPSGGFYVILGGEATARAKPAARTLKTGDYFGEMGLLDGAPRSASIVATKDLHVMRLSRGAFDAALDRHPTIARRLLTELGTRVRTLERQAARRSN